MKLGVYLTQLFQEMFENLDEQFGSRSGPKIFVPELGLTACKVYQQTSVVQAHISHEISGFAFSDIKEK